MERFWSKVDKAGDCWVWTGARFRSGYGQFWLNGKAVSAHRVAFELANGPVPAGLSVLHSCDNRPCVNHAHLRAGTGADNTRDAVERGGHNNARKDRCPRGHAYDYINPSSGKRACRACQSRHQMAYMTRKRATK